MTEEYTMNGKITDSFGRWISILYRYTNIYMEKQFKEYGLGAGQVKLLHLIYAHRGITQVEMTHILSLDKGTVTRSIKKLEHTGYIRRQRLKSDNRVYRLVVTDKGLKIKDYIDETLKGWTVILSNGFDGREKEEALNYLRRMAWNAQGYLGEEITTVH